MVRYNKQSSAKWRTCDVICAGRSLMNIKNSSGPRTVRCGTPDSTGAHDDASLSTTTCCDLSWRKLAIQVSVFCALRYDYGLHLLGESALAVIADPQSRDGVRLPVTHQRHRQAKLYTCTTLYKLYILLVVHMARYTWVYKIWPNSSFIF